MAALLVVAVSAVGIWFGIGSSGGAPPAPDTPEIRSVDVAPVQEQGLERTLAVVGSLSVYEAATVSTKVAGRLDEIGVDLGDTIEQGDVIARIDDRDYILGERQARTRHEQARARLGMDADDTAYVPLDDLTRLNFVQRAQAEWTQAQRRLEQAGPLSERGIAPGPQIESLELTAEVARTEYEEALEEARHRVALLEEREVELEIAQQRLADTMIRAPFDGAVEQRLAALGEYLNEGDPVGRLVRTDRLRLRVEVPERRAAMVELGQSLAFTTENDDQEHKAVVTRLSPQFDEQRRTLVVEADVESPGSLRPGAFVRGRIIVVDDEPALTVPSNAIASFAGVDRVFVASEGKAEGREVTIGRRSEQWVEIVEGLSQGERVIHEPGAIQTGDPVLVRDRGDADAARADGSLHASE